MAFPGGSDGWPARIIRWILAATCLGGGWWLIRGAYASGSVVPAFWLSLIALGILVIVALLLLPEALAIVTGPFFKLVDSLFFPGEKAGPPEIDHYCRLADRYREQERWEDLAEVCMQALRHHPGELRPYQELVALYSGQLDDPRRLRSLRRRARRHLAEEDLDQLDHLSCPPPSPPD